MTVETTSFLSGTKITSNGSEKSAKFIKNHKNLIICLLALILVLFCVSASILQIWLFNRINGMQQEIDQLQTSVADMKKNIAFDDELFDDLDEFGKKYDQSDVKEEIDLDDSNSDGKIKFDDVGDEDSLEGSDEIDDNYDGIHSGYGDSYDEEDDDQYDLDELEDVIPPTEEEEKKDDDNNIYKDMTRVRKARSISGITNQGVPIIEEPYVSRRNRSRNGSDDLVANALLPKSEKNPKLKLTWDSNRRNANANGPRRELHDRTSRYHSTRHHHNLQDSRNRFAFAAAPVQHSFENYGKKFNETPTSAAPVQSRRSRVMHVEDKSKAFRQVVRKDQLERLQEVRKAPEQWSPQNAYGRRRMMNPIRRNPELKNGKRMKITAVHYEGAATNQHHGFQGNHKVILNRNEYIHWQPASWMNSHGMDQFFTMDENGILTVKDHGLFLIYAQVFYSNEHDTNGYVIELNEQAKYQCTTMTHTTSKVTKTNTCYTSGLVHLSHGDKIKIKDLGNHRTVMLEPSRSFFGLVKINLLPAIIESSEVEAFNVAQK